MILDFLKELTNHPEQVKIQITHKRYALVSRLIKFVVYPAARKEGIDLRIQGRNLALTYFIFHDLPEFVGKDFDAISIVV
jgi:hypothetical protein